MQSNSTGQWKGKCFPQAVCGTTSVYPYTCTVESRYYAPPYTFRSSSFIGRFVSHTSLPYLTVKCKYLSPKSNKTVSTVSKLHVAISVILCLTSSFFRISPIKQQEKVQRSHAHMAFNSQERSSHSNPVLYF